MAANEAGHLVFPSIVHLQDVRRFLRSVFLDVDLIRFCILPAWRRNSFQHGHYIYSGSEAHHGLVWEPPAVYGGLRCMLVYNPNALLGRRLSPSWKVSFKYRN
jgi:hypothetical protein